MDFVGEIELLLDQLDNTTHFSKSEAIIAEYLVINADEISNLTATELGEKTYTSKATVLRFSKKLGFQRFSDLIHQLLIETIEQKRVLEIAKHRPVNQTTKTEELPTSVMAMYDEILTMTRLGINHNDLQRAINYLVQASHIDVYGVGITESCAQAAAFKFQTIGINSSAQTNVNEHFIAATRSDQTRTAIILSFTGGNPLMVETANYLRKQHVFIVGIGGNVDKSLSEQSDLYFNVPTRQSILNMEAVDQLMSINYILDTLFAGLTVRYHDNVIKNSVNLIERR